MATSNDIHREDLLTAVLTRGGLTARVEIKRVELMPAQATGRHQHPCPVVGYVAAGSIKFQIDGEPIRRLQTGDAFFEPRDARINHFDNESADEPAVFIAFYLLDEHEHRLIEML